MSDAHPSERSRWILVLGTMAAALILISIAAFTQAGWKAATLSAIVLNAIILGYVYAKKDDLIGKLWLFGTVAGFAELPSDYFSVAVADSLVYPDLGPFIWTSPAYMPFGYSILFVQLGFLARWFYQKWGLWPAVLLSGLVGALNVPAQELLADFANYWEYHNVKAMFGKVPYFIIVGEFALAAALPPMVKSIEKGTWKTATVWGLVMGVVMYVGWGGAHWLIDG